MKKISERYLSLFENFDFGIVICKIRDDGSNFIIKDINKKAMKFAIKKQKEEVINKKVTEVFSYIKNLGLISKMRKVYLTGENIQYPISYYDNKNYRKMIKFNIVKLDTDEIAVRYEDLTSEKIKENELKDTKDRLELAIEGANLGIWDWNIIKGNVKFNDKWAEMLGYDLEELDPDLKTWENLIHKKDRKKVFAKLDEHLDGSTNSYEVEHRLKTKDGDYTWVKDIGRVVRRDKSGQAIRAVGIHQDIDKRKRMERKLKEQKAYFEQLFAESTEGIVLLDNNGKIIKVNKHFEKLFGYQRKEAIGKNIDELITPFEKIKEGAQYTKEVIKGRDIKTESIREKKNGEKIHVSIHAFPINLKEGQIGIYGIYNDISERKEEEEKIRYLSFHDPMTGLYNRRYFENEIERLNESRISPVSIIIADIDKLKEINDNYGHKIGDKYIKKAAEVIKSVVRNEDIAARIGGDEYAVILPYTGGDTADKICNRINEKCSSLNREIEDRLGFPLEISVGYASSQENKDLDEVFIKADKKMYARRDGISVK